MGLWNQRKQMRPAWKERKRVGAGLPAKERKSSPLLLFLILALLLSHSLLAQALVPVAPEEVGIDGRRLSRLDGVLRDAIAQGEAPGAVLLVARKGRIVYRRAFGMRAVQPRVEPMTIDTIFDVASLTKVMATAPAVLLLVEEGRLSLTDPVSRYFPEFAVHGKEEINIRHLLTHYSGLPSGIELDDPWQGYATAIQMGAEVVPVLPPDQEFLYSDINFFELAEIVRRVSGESFDRFVEQRIFQPLKMTDTGFNPGPDKMGRIAPTEVRGGQMLRGTVHDPTAFRMGGVAGHAGVFSTVDDTAVWAQMILNGGTYGGLRLFSPLAILQMTQPQSPPEKIELRGLGFDISSRYGTSRGDLFPVGSFGHTGFTGTSVWIDPFSESLVILFTSRLHPDGKGNVVSLRKKVASVVASSILDFPWGRHWYYHQYQRE